jgi:hypothetical protein
LGRKFKKEGEKEIKCEISKNGKDKGKIKVKGIVQRKLTGVETWLKC